MSDRRNDELDGSDVDVDWVDEGGSRLAWLRAVVGIAWAQLTYDKMRTSLAVLGVVLAVLATTLLAGTGIGVVETGQEKFDASQRDLWIVGGPVQLTPGQLGGASAGIVEAHQLRRDIQQREEVLRASPLLFQTVYLSPNGSSPVTVAAVGVPNSGGIANSSGRGWGRDTYYADGSYDGNRTYEVMVDRRIAEEYNVSIGDSVYLGGTVAGTSDQEFTVVGYSSEMSQFLGVPTVTMPLSELQASVGKTGTDPASIMTVRLHEGENVSAMESELQRAYPGYDVRTNQEQLESTVQRQAVVIAGGASLVALAVVAGLALTLNVLLSLIQQQRATLAALKAVGCSSVTLAGVIAAQAIVVGIVGATIGVALVTPLAVVLDAVALAVTGFENVVRTSDELIALGFGVAVLMSLFSAVVAGSRIRVLSAVEALD